MLDVYVKNDSKYKSYAFKICGCNDLKNDIVNDMYLRLNEILKIDPLKEISDGYIYLMLRSIFIDSIRKKKEIPFEEVPDVVLNDSDLCSRITIDEVLSEMSFFDREILLKTQEMSLRKIGQDINCHHTTVSRMYNKSLDKAKLLCQQKGMLIERKKAKD